MGIVFPNTNIQEVSGKMNATGGRIVQVQETRSSASLSCANWATANTLFSGTITPISASNYILVYVFNSFRMDAGIGSTVNVGGAWSLGFMDVTNTAGTAIITSGWDGTWRNVIGSYEKQYLEGPIGSTSTQTYTVRCYNYPTGTCYWNTTAQNGHDGYAYLRLTEISV
jgi:hypothetical protein